jgi:HPr kinase/phosphorylase
MEYLENDSMGLTVRHILEQKQRQLLLDVVTGDVGLDRVVTGSEISSPGLVLAGFTARFQSGRPQVLGETEIAYLRTLDVDDRHRSLEGLLKLDVPCVFVTKGQSIPRDFRKLAIERGVPVLRSGLRTAEFYRRITPYLLEALAPSTSLHASLADVFGVGLLFTGRSGIGKSECVLDLVERGHRLVADDVVNISLRGSDILIGRATDISRRYMEIRGVGLIDIFTMFGARAVRQQKRIEVVVELKEWDSAGDVDRTGLDGQTKNILGVDLPLAVVPLNPGKNITVVSEVVALNHLLRYSGIDPANAFNERLLKQMAEQRELKEYLAEDYE